MFTRTIGKASKKVTSLAIVLLLMLVPLHGVSAAEDTISWLASDDPEMEYVELDQSHVVPYSVNYNTDCSTRNFDVITREPKTQPNQTELRHKSECAVATSRGMHDGQYLDAGVPAGPFTDLNGNPMSILRIPNSKALLSTYSSSVSGYLEIAIYDSIAPNYNSLTGQVQFRLSPYMAPKFSDPAGNKFRLRGGSFGYSRNGKWMIAESSVGFLRINLETMQALPFAPPLNYSGSNPFPRVAVSEDGRYTAIASKNNLFKIYDLDTCAVTPNAIIGPVACQYKDLQSFMASKFNSYRVSDHIRFVDPEQLAFVAGYNDLSGAIKRASVRISPNGQKIQKTSYLALGDSFSSGEGIMDIAYEAGTDESNPRNRCHLSRLSYPYLVGQSLELSETEFHNVACSGARSEHFFERVQYDNIEQFTPIPGEETQSRLLMWAQPSSITISMIGNDIGFSDKLTECLVYPSECFHYKEDREALAREIHSKFTTLVDLYQSIKEDSKEARIYVLGYPQIFSMGSECGVNVRFSQNERQTARNLTSYLNSTIKAAAEKTGVQYIDVENALVDHQLCDKGEKAVNGLTAGNDAPLTDIGPIGNESFHPNALGHRLMAQSLIDQSENLAKPMPSPVNDATAPNIGSAVYLQLTGDAPAKGQSNPAALHPITNVKNVEIKGATITPKVDIPLKPNSTLEASFHSTPTPAGSLATNSNGELTGSITVPQVLDPGYHTLHIVGQNLAGQQIDLYKIIYVADSAEDIDGDGTLNYDEKCLAIEPSNADQDQDGTDDACDAVIDDRPIDTAPPIVTGATDRVPNINGWLNQDTIISWTAFDSGPPSSPSTVPQPTMVSQEGEITYVSEESCDQAENCATGNLQIKLDKTPPTIGVPSWVNNPKPALDTASVSTNVSDSLSGIDKVEYFLGESDPGYDNGVEMNLTADLASAQFSPNIPTGIHKITLRAKDKAGNWSIDSIDYLVVLGSTKNRLSGKLWLVPSLSDGDILPGLISTGQTDQAKVRFDIRYDKKGNVHKSSKFIFKFSTGTRCNKPTKAQNCHSFELRSSTVNWMTTYGPNHSSVVVQGRSKLILDGEQKEVTFRLSALDGERLDTNLKDHVAIKVYNKDDNPHAAVPIYQINTELSKGNIKIRQPN